MLVQNTGGARLRAGHLHRMTLREAWLVWVGVSTSSALCAAAGAGLCQGETPRAAIEALLLGAVPGQLDPLLLAGMGCVWGCGCRAFLRKRPGCGEWNSPPLAFLPDQSFRPQQEAFWPEARVPFTVVTLSDWSFLTVTEVTVCL